MNRTDGVPDDNVLRNADERIVWELCGCAYENFRQPPYHQLKITRHHPRAEVTFELLCPFPMNEAGEHDDLHYCTMIDAWPQLRLKTEGAQIEMAWRAIGMCFVQWEANNAGIDHLLDVGLRIPGWAKRSGVIDVFLDTFGQGEDFTVWIAPVDPALAAQA